MAPTSLNCSLGLIASPGVHQIECESKSNYLRMPLSDHNWPGALMTVEPKQSTDQQSATEVATLGGGCFWCLEAVYVQVRGVHRVESGYSGGKLPNPTYELVCTGTTGHAEVIQVSYDPAAISFREILEVFFGIHDPTTPNRQGADV